MASDSVTRRERSLLSVLSSRVIVVRLDLVDMLGDINSAVWLSDLLYQHEVRTESAKAKGEEFDGWIKMTLLGCFERTRLGRRAQERAYSRMDALGIVEKTTRGMPGKPHYKINASALVNAIDEWKASGVTITPPATHTRNTPVTPKRANSKIITPVTPKRANMFVQNGVTNSLSTSIKICDDDKGGAAKKVFLPDEIPPHLRNMKPPKRKQSRPDFLDWPIVVAVQNGFGGTFAPTRNFAEWLKSGLSYHVDSGNVTLGQLEERAKWWRDQGYLIRASNDNLMQVLLNGPQEIKVKSPARKSATPGRTEV